MIRTGKGNVCVCVCVGGGDEENGSLGRLKLNKKVNIETYLKEVGWEGVN